MCLISVESIAPLRVGSRLFAGAFAFLPVATRAYREIAVHLIFWLSDLLMSTFATEVMTVTLTAVELMRCPMGEVGARMLSVTDAFLTSDVLFVSELVPVNLKTGLADAGL